MTLFIIKPYISTLSSFKTMYIGFKVAFVPNILGNMKKPSDNGKILLGRRIRSLRNTKGWTQQELGERADINYKFLGEIERGMQNPSFNILEKIATALEIPPLELFRFEHEVSNRKEIEKQIVRILKTIPDNDVRQIFMLLRVLYPISK